MEPLNGPDPEPHKLSVALATYNGAIYLEDLLYSLNRQTRMPWEVVATDDASSDSTLEILHRHESRLPLKIIQNRERGGVIANFNRALSACSGDYIALADQDDVWLPGKCAKLLEKMLEQERLLGQETPILIFCNLNIVDDKLAPIPPFELFRSVYEIQERQRVTDLLVRNSIPGCAMLINRALLQRAMPIPEGFFMHDWWLALTAAAFGTIKGVDAALLQYRQHEANACGISDPQRRFQSKLIRWQSWSHFNQEARRRTHIIMTNLDKFERQYGTILPFDVRRETALFRRRFASPLGRPWYALRVHSNFKLWKLCQKRPRSIGKIVKPTQKA
jgi:glycosyltransferase involved in cell wall biosynthesis